jgi:hypothetical protein
LNRSIVGEVRLEGNSQVALDLFGRSPGVTYDLFLMSGVLFLSENSSVLVRVSNWEDIRPLIASPSPAMLRARPLATRVALYPVVLCSIMQGKFGLVHPESRNYTGL